MAPTLPRASPRQCQWEKPRLKKKFGQVLRLVSVDVTLFENRAFADVIRKNEVKLD